MNFLSRIRDNTGLPAVAIGGMLGAGSVAARETIMAFSQRPDANSTNLALAGITAAALAATSVFVTGSRIHTRDLIRHPHRPRTWGSSLREATLLPAIAACAHAGCLGIVAVIIRYTSQTPAGQESILTSASLVLAAGLGLFFGGIAVNNDYPPVSSEEQPELGNVEK